jgi:hypothetical protein
MRRATETESAGLFKHRSILFRNDIVLDERDGSPAGPMSVLSQGVRALLDLKLLLKPTGNQQWDSHEQKRMP